MLPAACSRHGAGEEELEEERLWPSHAGGFLLHIPHREVSGRQLSIVIQHGSRSAHFIFSYVPSKPDYLFISVHLSSFLFAFYTGEFYQIICSGFHHFTSCHLGLLIRSARSVMMSLCFTSSVCRRFLQQCTEHQECLYEVEAPGAWTQRRNIWLNIQLGHYCLSNNVTFHVILQYHQLAPNDPRFDLMH